MHIISYNGCSNFASLELAVIQKSTDSSKRISFFFEHRLHTLGKYFNLHF
jgi:hypothetical protein